MKKCPICSRIYDDSQAFCLDDGTALLNEPAPDQAQETQISSRKKKSRLPIIFAALLLLIGALAIGWFLLAPKETENVAATNRQNAANVQTPAPSPSPTVTPTPLPSPSPEATAPANVNTATNTETNSNSAPTSESSQDLPVIMKTEDHSVLFGLQQCRKSGSAITCDLLLTNKGSDRRFEFDVDRSNVFDELGNSYKGKIGRVANQDGSTVRIGFISGVTTKAQITFEGVEPNAAKITLLRLQYDVGEDYNLEIKFRNVPLTISK